MVTAVLTGYGVLQSTYYPGVPYSSLEYVMTAVAMDYRVQKLSRIRGGSYTGSPLTL